MTTTLSKEEALQELARVRDELNGFAAHGASLQMQVGATVYSALSRRLAETAGYKNAWEYFGNQVKGLTRETLRTYCDEAMYWGATRTQKYGLERLMALSRYLRANPPDIIGQWPDPDPRWIAIRVPQPDGSLVVKSFADCSLEEMRRAAWPPKPKPAWERLPALDRLRSLVLRELLPQYFRGKAKVGFSARIHEGRAFVSLRDVPVAELEELIGALQECIAIKPLEPRLRK